MGMHDLLQKDPEMWDLFCRKEEYQSTIRDKEDRFPYYASSSPANLRTESVRIPDE